MIRKIKIVGVPLDLGQGRRGVDMGPSALRVAGLNARIRELGYVVEDAGNVPVAIAETKEEVLELIQEAIEFHIEGLVQRGEPVPEPSVEAGTVTVAVTN